MSLLFMDSFDHYATADLTEKWTSKSGSVSTIGAYGRNSTNGLLQDDGYLSATVLGGVDEVIVGVAVKITHASPTLASGFIGFGTSTNWQCALAVNPDLTLQPMCVNSTGWAPGKDAQYAPLIGTPSTYALQVGVWAYIEVRMKCNATTGTCLVRVNGTEVLNLTGLDTSWDGTSLTRFALGGQWAVSHFAFQYDDLVVMDLNGSVNNAFLGDVTVTALYPSGAGTTSGWTPSAGSNYQNVDETSPNDDTDYNSTATLNAKDTYAMQDCAAGADIRAVQILATVRKGSEGPGQVKLVTRSSSTDYDGSARGIGGTTYSYVREIRETDPATAAAWSESGWNAVEIGLKKTG